MNGQPTEAGGKKTNVVFLAVVGAVLLLAAFLVGLAVGIKSGGVLPGVKTAECDESAVIARLTDAGFIPPSLNTTDPVYDVEGTVLTVGSGYVDISAALTPLEEPTMLRVMIGPETDLIIRTPKDSVVLGRELAAFDDAIQNFDPAEGPPPEPPESYTESVATLADLAAGTNVMVSTEADIRVNQTFTATQVTIFAADQEDLAPEEAPIEEPVPVVSDEEPPVEEPVEPAADEEPPVEEPPVE